MAVGANGASHVRSAWLIVALVAAAGAGAIVMPAQRRIEAIESHAAQLSDLAARNEELAARIGALERTRDRVRADLRRLAGKSGLGSATVAMLHAIETEAKLEHLTIASIVPESSNALSGDATFAVSMHGRYRDVVAAVIALSHHDVLIEVRDVALQSATTPATFPSVDASIDATLYRSVDDVARKEGPDARAVTR